MIDGIRSATLNSLLTRLHDAIVNFVKNIEGIIADNKEVSIDDIRELRDHVQQRLVRREEAADNKRILKLLDLFATDKAVLELVKEDAEEWLGLLEAIENNILGKGEENLTKAEKKEIEEINRLTSEIKGLIRS